MNEVFMMCDNSCFTIVKVNKLNGHQDFYFRVTDDELHSELVRKYMEQGLAYVSFIYSIDEDALYMTKGFIFNKYTVSCNSEPEIKQILKQVASDYKGV